MVNNTTDHATLVFQIPLGPAMTLEGLSGHILCFIILHLPLLMATKSVCTSEEKGTFWLWLLSTWGSIIINTALRMITIGYWADSSMVYLMIGLVGFGGFRRPMYRSKILWSLSPIIYVTSNALAHFCPLLQKIGCAWTGCVLFEVILQIIIALLWGLMCIASVHRTSVTSDRLKQWLLRITVTTLFEWAVFLVLGITCIFCGFGGLPMAICFCYYLLGRSMGNRHRPYTRGMQIVRQESTC